jgi:hypothetical protein
MLAGWPTSDGITQSGAPSSRRLHPSLRSAITRRRDPSLSSEPGARLWRRRDCKAHDGRRACIRILKILKTGIPQNRSGKVACFSSPENDRQLTSFHQRSTINHHQKTTFCTPVFPKPQQKRRLSSLEKNTGKRSLFRGGSWLLTGGRRGAGRRDLF